MYTCFFLNRDLSLATEHKKFVKGKKIFEDLESPRPSGYETRLTKQLQELSMDMKIAKMVPKIKTLHNLSYGPLVLLNTRRGTGLLYITKKLICI